MNTNKQDTNKQEMISKHVRDMLAVENEMHAAFRRQKKDDRLSKLPRAASVVSEIEDTIDRHLEALRRCLSRYGAGESTLKQAVGSVLGAAAGIYNGMRSDEPVSRMLRDDYIALSTAVVCYEMLHVTALAAGEQKTADLALEHLKEYAPLVIAITETLPHALVEEMGREGKLNIDHQAAERAVRNTKAAWMDQAVAG